MRRAVAIFAVGVGAAALAQPPTPPPPVARVGIAPPPPNAYAGPRAEGTPAADPSDAVYPITLPAALKLAGARPLDIAIADQQVAAAAKRLDRANLAWVPNVTVGMDYFRHEGGQQNFAGDILRSSRGTYMVGVGPNAVVSVTDAVFAPLAARQELAARAAARQAAENDSALAVVEAYFATQQARGELAGAVLAEAKAREVAGKAEKLAEGLVAPLEATRAKVELARRTQVVATARERWRTASAELVRLLRLKPGLLVEPVEEPYLPVTVIDPAATADVLLPVALANRPELAGRQAVAQASAARLRQEKARPLLPTVALRGAATNPGGSLAWGGFGGGPNDRTQAFGSRFDMDVQVLWEFEGLGLTNRARVGERRAEQQLAVLELARTQDRIAAEVSSAFAQAKAAGERLAAAEPALREAVKLVDDSLTGMGQTKRVGDTNVLLVRPQEVVAAVQALAQANADFYAAVGDYNRGQFRLYRALGHPAECLSGGVESKAVVISTLPPAASPIPPQPLPANLPPVGSVLPTSGVVRAEAREVMPVPTDRAVNWWEVAIARELVYRRRSAVVLTETPPPDPQWQVVGGTPPPAPKPPAPDDGLTWQKAKEK